MKSSEILKHMENIIDTISKHRESNGVDHPDQETLFKSINTLYDNLNENDKVLFVKCI